MNLPLRVAAGPRALLVASALTALACAGLTGCFQDFEEFRPGNGGNGGSGPSGGGGAGGEDLCAGVDCSDDNLCTQDICEAGECSNPPAVTVTLQQVIGDCKNAECDGDMLVQVADPDDTPTEDGNMCTDETCVGDMPAHPELPDGTVCNTDGTCQEGVCSACDEDADCGDITSDCATFNCNDRNACDPTVFTAAGTVIDDPTDGDCMAVQCDGVNPTSMNAPLVADIDDDGNVCTLDTCTVAGVPENTPQVGMSCGDNTDNQCTNPDTCDALGACVANHENNGTACGSNLNDACTNPDTCNGSGTCLPNHEINGFACGSNMNTECTNPDTCNGMGTCLVNDETAGTPCGSGTDDTCTNPDTCNGTGTCQLNNAADGIPCGSNMNTSCSNPDTCLTGACNVNDEIAGFACPDADFCDGPETCNGTGTCSATGVNPCPGTDTGPSCDDSCDEDAMLCTEPDVAGTVCDETAGGTTGMCTGNSGANNCAGDT